MSVLAKSERELRSYKKTQFTEGWSLLVANYSWN